MSQESKATLDDIKDDTTHILDHICKTDTPQASGVFDWFQKIWQQLTDTPTAVQKLLTGGAMGKIATGALALSAKIADGIRLMSGFLQHVGESQTDRVSQQNRQAMLTFVGGFDQVVAATNELAGRAQIPAPNLSWPDLSWLTAIIPSFLVNLLSMAGNGVISNWSNLPADAAAKIRAVQLDANGVPNDLGHSAAVALMAVRIIANLLENAKEFVPDDLSLNVEILGEGGGTEVAGHPAKLLFQIPLTVLGAADPILEYLTALAEMTSRNVRAVA